MPYATSDVSGVLLSGAGASLIDALLTKTSPVNIAAAVPFVLAAGNDEFDPEAYVGNLENDGVGIAPFHNFEDKVNPELAAELETIKAGIIDGSIKVESSVKLGSTRHGTGSPSTSTVSIFNSRSAHSRSGGAACWPATTNCALTSISF